MAEKRRRSDDSENVDPDKKKKLSLSLERKGNRFATTSEDQLQSMSVYNMSKNSAVSSKWALKNLRDWREEYNMKHPTKLCPEEILSPNCTKELSLE